VRPHWLAFMLGLTVATSGAAQTPSPGPVLARPDPEEPDFFFLTGGPYTQARRSYQVIHATSYGVRRAHTGEGRLRDRELILFFRTEYGITDRWELDVITPSMFLRTELGGSQVASGGGYADTVGGVRYRFLDESRAPLTLTMGPQLILPTGNAREGTGAGSRGFAWDVAAAKDWGGPLFLSSSVNYSLLFAVKDPTRGSRRDFRLHGLEWAVALVLRAFEPPPGKPPGEADHDVHVFLEGAGSWLQGLTAGQTVGQRAGQLAWQLAPGIRYGYVTPRKTLVEIGMSVPVGLGPNGSKWGLIVQFQFEQVLGSAQ